MDKRSMINEMVASQLHLPTLYDLWTREWTYSPEITANLMLPCSSLAIRSASSINSVPKPYQTIQSRKSQRYKKGKARPDVGTWSDHGHAQVQLCHTHEALVQCYNPHLILPSSRAPDGTCPLQSTSSAAEDQWGYPSRGLRMKGRSPNLHSRCSRVGAALPIRV